MYILFEAPYNDGSEAIYLYEAVGYTDTDIEAMLWCNENKDYRHYKYLPDKKISYRFSHR